MKEIHFHSVRSLVKGAPPRSPHFQLMTVHDEGEDCPHSGVGGTYNGHSSLTCLGHSAGVA